MKRYVLTGVFASLLILTGCTQSVVTPTSQPTTDTEKSLHSEYEQLPETNNLYYMEKQGVETLLLHGTGILVLSFPECPWCQAYLPQLNTILEKNDAKAAYYNIREDKTEDRTFYDQIASDIESVNDTGTKIIEYNNDGQQVIYMPLVLFIENGRITAYNNETCMEDSAVIKPEEYWTEEKKTALASTLDTSVAKIKAAQEENDAKGCDNGCKVD